MEPESNSLIIPLSPTVSEDHNISKEIISLGESNHCFLFVAGNGSFSTKVKKLKSKILNGESLQYF